MIASTETNEVAIWLKRDDPTPVEARALYVGRVLVVAQHRGRGYARVLTQLVLERARERARDPASGVVLTYGHADPKLEPVYASHASFQRALDVVWYAADPICALEGLPETRTITDAVLPSVLALDDRQLRDELAASSPTGTHFAIRPTLEHLSMRYAGADYIFDKMRGGRDILKARGVMISDPSEPSTFAFVLWIPCFASNSAPGCSTLSDRAGLTILRVRASTSLQFRALASAVRPTAASSLADLRLPLWRRTGASSAWCCGASIQLCLKAPRCSPWRASATRPALLNWSIWRCRCTGSPTSATAARVSTSEQFAALSG